MRKPFPALQRWLEGIVDGHAKVFCRFDYGDWGAISEGQRSGRWLADGKVAARAWVIIRRLFYRVPPTEVTAAV